MKKRVLYATFALVLVIMAVTGCDLFGSKITIMVQNKSDLPMSIYYRASGETEWEVLVSAIIIDGVTFVDVPAGSYDFRATWASATDPDDAVSLVGTELDVLLDYQYNWDDEAQSYDYSANIYNTIFSVY